jgi:hypothetical protein
MHKIINLDLLFGLVETVISDVYDDNIEPYYGFMHYNTPAIDSIGNYKIDSISFELDDIIIKYETNIY